MFLMGFGKEGMDSAERVEKRPSLFFLVNNF